MKSLSKKILLLILVVILLIFFHQFGVLAKIEIYLRLPFISLGEKISNSNLKIKNYFETFSSKEQLIKENKELKKENQKLLSENKDLKIFLKEKEILTEQIEFLKKKKYNYVLCHIIGKSSDSPLITESLILDGGENEGIRTGYPVITDQGFLVGKIVKTEKNISYLNIILNNQSSVAAKVLSQQGLKYEETQGVVAGMHQLSLKMDFILPDKKINKDDLVVTSGLETLVPKDLIIGKVREVKFEPGDFFQKATIDPLIDFDNLEIVSVLIPGYEIK